MQLTSQLKTAGTEGARRQARIWRVVLAGVTFVSVLAVAEPAWAWPMCGCG